MFADRNGPLIERLDETRARFRDIALPAGQQAVEGSAAFRNELARRSEVVTEEGCNAVRRGLQIGATDLEHAVERLPGAFDHIASRRDMAVEQTDQMIRRPGEVGSMGVEEVTHLGQSVIDVREPIDQPVGHVPGQCRRLCMSLGENAADLVAGGVDRLARARKMGLEQCREALAGGADLGAMAREGFAQRGCRLVDVILHVGGSPVDQGRQSFPG